MPSFLQTTFLTGLIALAVPVLIHLFFRMKSRRVELGTLRFLRMAFEENARRRRLLQWLLLAMRLGLVALLVILFARPFLATARDHGDHHRLVILIDQSATMQLRGENGRLIDEAVQEARRLIERSGAKSNCAVAFFDDRVHPWGMDGAPSKSTPGASARELRAPAVLTGATNYGRALAWARDTCVQAEAGPIDLHVFTDLQRSGLDWTEFEPLPAGVVTHLHDLGKPTINNLGVTEVRTPSLWVRPSEAPTVRASIMHGGRFVLENVPVVLEIGRIDVRADKKGGTSQNNAHRQDFAKLADRFVRRERVKLEPGTSITLDFELPPLAEGAWQGRVSVEYDDDLAFDNERPFAISATPAYRVLIVNGGSSPAALETETYYLDAALRLAHQGASTYAGTQFTPTTVEWSETASLPPLADFEAVCLANVADISATDARRLAEFVRLGGGLLVFTGEKTTAAACSALSAAGLAVGQIGELNTAVDLPWTFDKWDESHPIFEPLNDPQHGDLRRLKFAAYTRIEPAPGVNVLARFNSGDPALLEKKLGDGRVLWVSTSCGSEWSDWSVSRLFLPLVHQMLGYEVGLADGGRVRMHLIDADADAGPNSAGAASETSTPATLLPGVVQHARYTEVIQISPRESETDRCTPEEFEERFGLKSSSPEQTPVGRSAKLAGIEAQPNELWPWVGCLLMGVLLLEGFVGNRTTA
jgi:hypothetical protein